MGAGRKLESTESALAKHPLADAPDLDERLEALARKQVEPSHARRVAESWCTA